FFQAEDGIRAFHVTGVQDVCSSDLAYICRLNWITGHPVKGNRHYRWQRDRQPVLHVKRHASITNRHLIDCSNRVEIGEFTTFARSEERRVGEEGRAEWWRE